MKIARDNQRAEEIWSFVRAAFSKPRELKPDEVHVSELLAPRKAYWVRTTGEERVSEEMIGLFAAGEAWHLLLQHVCGIEFAEKKVRHCGVIGTQDLHPPDGESTELKTSRKYTVPDECEPRYVDQITAYMAMEDAPVGHVVVIYTNAGRKWDGSKSSMVERASWRIELTKKEREDIRAALVEQKDRLLEAVKNKQPKAVDLCADWMCANIYKGEVNSVCPFYEDCKPEGRWPLKVLVGDPKPKAARKRK